MNSRKKTVARHEFTVARLAFTVVRLAFTVLLLALLASCSRGAVFPVHTLVIHTVAGTNIELKAEIARSEAEQARGYMERKTIPDGTGMLFVFPTDRIFGFWMENTPYPLSIAYIDSSGIIREIHDMEPFSRSVVSSSRSLRYALEVPSGWFTRAGIKLGDTLDPDTLSAALAATENRK